MSLSSLRRRHLVLAGSGALLGAPHISAAQPGRAGSRAPLVVAQIHDTSAAQQDVSKDFLIGSRAAWQDINAKGGLRGRAVEHRSIEVDGTPASLRAALTQAVPMVNASLPIVRAYRETLARLFDEPPAPLSLAGFIARATRTKCCPGSIRPRARPRSRRSSGARRWTSAAIVSPSIRRGAARPM